MLEGKVLANKICPICEVEMANDHSCFDYNFSDISLEMELLDLSFKLEPYGTAEEDNVHHFEPEYNAINIDMKSRSVPFFLRL